MKRKSLQEIEDYEILKKVKQLEKFKLNKKT